MILRTATLSGFKSFRKSVPLFFSHRTSVLIGPNDHGKTNVLLAIQKLGKDQEFSTDEINDRSARDGTLAEITYELQLTEAETAKVKTLIQPLLEQEANAESELLSASQTALPSLDSSEPPSTVGALQKPYSLGVRPILQWWTSLMSSKSIEFVRQPGKPLDLKEQGLSEAARASLMTVLESLMPKVFLFTPSTLRQLPDTVNLATLEANEVMQGVFRLAGIWASREALLSGNTRQNQDELREASGTLTTQIRKNWTQGEDLEFHLEYVGSEIRLTVKDTAKTVTAVAERSEGFTAYFAMRMLLVARTNQATPNGYVFMFDEPGLNLHPKGQVDLQNVFEDISHHNQIIYSTHSVFLINKNYPQRNHLVYKDAQGSKIDNKPFVGGWAMVKEHLGLYLSANFLFSDKILLAEGSSDEIYLPLILQGLIERGCFDGDLNAFAMHSTISSKEMMALASIYVQEQRAVAVLVDGDEEGRRRKDKIGDWANRSQRQCPVIILSDFKDAPCSIEDFLESSAYRKAVCEACKQAIDGGYLQAPADGDWRHKLNSLLDTPDGKSGTAPKSLGERVENATNEIFGESISDNVVAIKYSEILDLKSPDSLRENEGYWKDDALQKLAKALWNALKLPQRGDITAIPLAE